MRVTIATPGSAHSRFMELTAQEWFALLGGSLMAVVAISTLDLDVTLWPALGLWLTAIVLGHLCMTAGRSVAFPDLVALAACLQWIVAPWLSERYPPSFVLFRMSLAATDYLQYTVPASAALWVALHLPLDRKLSDGWSVPDVRRPLTKRVRNMLDVTIVIGLFVEAYNESFPQPLAFLAYLIGSLRFFAVLGWMVTQTRGWWIRAAIVLLHLIAQQSTGGVFYLVVHWGGYFLLVYAFMSRWRWQVAVAIGIGFLVISVLQDVKPAFRSSLAKGEVSGEVESFGKLVSLMWDRVRGGNLLAEVDFGDFLVRFNQGWIISRVMTHVPAHEPYARGSTLIDAMIDSIVPRALFPTKREGVSQEMFRRYTGVELGPGTKMGLGIIGEFYANFGPAGGVLATFVYGLLMGWLFALFAERATLNPLWWAAAAIVVLPGIEPGFNFEDIANHVVKAAVVFVVLLKTVPALRELLATGSPPAPEDGQQPAAALA